MVAIGESVATFARRHVDTGFSAERYAGRTVRVLTPSPTTDFMTETTNSSKRAWITPNIEVLPRLSELTLQSPTPIPGGGGTGGGGSTVVP